MAVDILHYQKNTAGKLLTLLFGETYKVCNGNQTLAKEKCNLIKTIINEECLGTSACPANFIIECENGKISNVKLTNDNTKKIMLNIFNIINIIYDNEILEKNTDLVERKDNICRIFALYMDYFVEL